ncbi:MAG TPA: transcriptional regulator, partial [Armatimonadota bacterium]|nr:transcriptional regulator [Armatimonadota bacterium]
MALPLRPIHTEEDYEQALWEIGTLFEAQSCTPEGDRLEVLTTLVEAYERQQHPVPPPDPVEALLYYLESRGLARRDLEPYLGSRARVAEVLNRRRGLTIEMIRRLHQGLGLPAEVLIRP